MHTGKIKKIVLERGFGFIADSDGTEVFFHKSELKDADIGSLSSNDDVEFETKKTPKGLSAINISVVKK
jgi:CspA family cold shock protein